MNYSARERFAQLMQSQGQAMAAPVQGTRSSQMMSAVRMANGGAVNSLPTLQEMANPNYQFQGVQLGANAPFTQFNPIVPMFSLEAPAFGGMEQSTYDFTAPVVQGGSMYQPPRQEPVMTESTSAYRPVDATTVMDSSGNIPNVPSDPYAPPDPYTFVDPNTPAPYVPPVGQTQPVAQPAPVITQPAPVITQPAPVAPPAGVATTSTSIPTVITAEERAAREAAGIQAELERRMAAERAAQEAAAQAEALRLEQAEQERLAEAQAQAQAKAQADADARAFAERIAAAAADKNAQIKKREDERIAAEAAAAAQAEQDRIAAEQAAQAVAAEEERRREWLWSLSPFLAELGNVPRPAGMEAPAAPAAPTYDVFGNEDPGPEYYESLNQQGA